MGPRDGGLGGTAARRSFGVHGGALVDPDGAISVVFTDVDRPCSPAVVDVDDTLVTERLLVRPPTEADRPRFVELFGDEAFMVFSGGPLSALDANRRFDTMLARCAELPFAKQPIVERSTGTVVGYTGVDRIELESGPWLEWGYRLAPEARGRGYATEASRALLDVAARRHAGDLLGIVHPANAPSRAVIRKLGFEYWKRAPVLGDERDLFRLEL